MQYYYFLLKKPFFIIEKTNHSTAIVLKLIIFDVYKRNVP